MEANCWRRIMSDGATVMGRVGFGAERRWKILRSFWKKLTEVEKKRSKGLSWWKEFLLLFGKKVAECG